MSTSADLHAARPAAPPRRPLWALVQRVVPALPVSVRDALWSLGLALGRFGTHAYSQEGEDLILARVLEDEPGGFYVDVGAHHPKRYSNTFLFYRRGWRGVNVDAAPGSMAAFRRVRPRDVNVETAISAQPGRTITFYVFNDPALNTVDPELARERVARGFRLVRRVDVVTRTLAEVLRETLPPGQAITFLTVDVEGLDLDVLRSNDWEAYRPRYVLAECLGLNAEELPAGEVYRFMRAQGYRFFAKTPNTTFFADERRAAA